jgi:hypothetical protein
LGLLDFWWTLRGIVRFSANEDGLTLTKYVLVNDDEEGGRFSKPRGLPLSAIPMVLPATA